MDEKGKENFSASERIPLPFLKFGKIRAVRGLSILTNHLCFCHIYCGKGGTVDGMGAVGTGTVWIPLVFAQGLCALHAAPVRAGGLASRSSDAEQSEQHRVGDSFLLFLELVERKNLSGQLPGYGILRRYPGHPEAIETSLSLDSHPLRSGTPTGGADDDRGGGV